MILKDIFESLFVGVIIEKNAIRKAKSLDMNWVGGARQRIKVKNEKKIQREFFERQRKVQRVETFKKYNENGEKKSAISQDLMFLYPIKSKHMSGDPIGAKNQVNYVDLSKARKNRVYHNGVFGKENKQDQLKSELEFSTPDDDINKIIKRSKDKETPKNKSVIEKHIEMTIARSKEKAKKPESLTSGIKRKLSDSVYGNKRELLFNNRNFFPAKSSTSEGHIGIKITRGGIDDRGNNETLVQGPLSSTPNTRVLGSQPHSKLFDKTQKDYQPSWPHVHPNLMSIHKQAGFIGQDDVARDNYFNLFQALPGIPKIKEEKIDDFEENERSLNQEISDINSNTRGDKEGGIRAFGGGGPSRFPLNLRDNRPELGPFKTLNMSREFKDISRYIDASCAYQNPSKLRLEGDSDDDYGPHSTMESTSLRQDSILSLYDQEQQEQNLTFTSKYNNMQLHEDDSEEERMRQMIYKQKHVYSGPVDIMGSKRSVVDIPNIESPTIKAGITERSGFHTNLSNEGDAGKSRMPNQQRNASLVERREQNEISKDNKIEFEAATGPRRHSQSYNETLAEVMGTYENSNGSTSDSPVFHFTQAAQSATDADQQVTKTEDDTLTPSVFDPKQEESVVPSVMSPTFNQLTEDRSNNPVITEVKMKSVEVNSVELEFSIFTVDQCTQTCNEGHNLYDKASRNEQEAEMVSTEVQTIDMCCPFCNCKISNMNTHTDGTDISDQSIMSEGVNEMQMVIIPTDSETRDKAVRMCQNSGTKANTYENRICVETVDQHQNQEVFFEQQTRCLREISDVVEGAEDTKLQGTRQEEQNSTMDSNCKPDSSQNHIQTRSKTAKASQMTNKNNT